MKTNRIRWLGLIALGIIILVTLLAAPNNQSRAGSTYNRAPDGYGAWYTFMQQQGTPVQRWQKPFSDLVAAESLITLLRINSQLSPRRLSQPEREWVEKGNTLVILGVRGQVTAAPFTTIQDYRESIIINTRRRLTTAKEQQILLGDRFGGVVWQEKIGEGQAIFCTTPHLAANAYQDYPGNYKYLAQLVSQSGKSIWVDEYIHGYTDADVRETAGTQDWVAYLAQKPLFPALLQAGILLLVFIWADNRRFGQAIALTAPVVDNSAAYIEALAGVLQKAESSDFVVDMVGKAEQLQLQQRLGLGQVLLDRPTLVKAWVQQTGRSPAELEQLLKLQTQKRRMGEKDLLNWIKQWQIIRSYAKSD